MKSVFKILLLERPQSYYLFRFLAIKSLFILGFWFLFCNFIGVTEIFAHHLQTTGSTMHSRDLRPQRSLLQPFVSSKKRFGHLAPDLREEFQAGRMRKQNKPLKNGSRIVKRY